MPSTRSFRSTICAVPSSRVFYSPRKRGWLPALCCVLALMLCGAWDTPSAHAVPPTITTLTVTSGGSAVTTVGSGSVVTLTATVTTGSTPVTPDQVNFCDAAATYCTDIHLLATA
jgi:hypothetical protein